MMLFVSLLESLGITGCHCILIVGGPLRVTCFAVISACSWSSSGIVGESNRDYFVPCFVYYFCEVVCEVCRNNSLY